MSEQTVFDPFSGTTTAVVVQQAEIAPAAASNPFIAPKREGYYIPHSPREIRCMCEKSKGYFADASDMNLGAEFKFTVLAWRELHGVKFSTEYPEPETVVQCIVVDTKKIVNQIVFRTYSMGNFMNVLTEIELAGLPLAQALITARMERRTGKKSGYTFHIVGFGYEPTTDEQFMDLAKFVQSNPSVMNSYKELPTV